MKKEEKKLRIEALEKLNDYKKEELEEIREFVKPKNILKRIFRNLRFVMSFPGMPQIHIMDIQIKHIERQTRMMEEYDKQINDLRMAVKVNENG